MTHPTAAFGSMLPGFDFMQGLVKNAGAALPGINQWIAPTLDPEELEKRIQELKTVQFWLEQNARLLGTSIQALEVQRMTLSTLKTMNVSLGDLAESLRARVPSAAPAPAPEAAPAPAPAPDSTPAANPFRLFMPPAPSAAAEAPAVSAVPEPAAPTAPGLVDPMQWWSALTQQFTELATKAVQDGAAAAAVQAAAAGAAQAAGQQAKHPASGGASSTAHNTAASPATGRAPAKTATKAAASAKTVARRAAPKRSAGPAR